MIDPTVLVPVAVSSDRFGRYLAAREEDVSRAYDVYMWNARVSASFYLPLQILEIAYRNACNRELSDTFGANWTTQPAFLGIDQRLHYMIHKAEEQVKKSSKDRRTTNGDTVASLSFGFWTTLLSTHLEHTVWTPAVSRVFADYKSVEGRAVTRNIAAKAFNDIRSFRNRIAHHEPIFYRNLHSDHARLATTASWLSGDVAAWLSAESRACVALLTADPPS